MSPRRHDGPKEFLLFGQRYRAFGVALQLSSPHEFTCREQVLTNRPTTRICEVGDHGGVVGICDDAQLVVL